MKEGRYYEAYGLLQVLHEAGQEFRDIAFLLRYYSSLVLINHFEHAETVFDDLLEIFQKCVITRPENILKIAEKQREKKHFVESICLCRIAAACFLDSFSPEVDLTPLQCLQNISRCIAQMVDSDASLRLTAMKNVVPPALAIFRGFQNMRRLKNKHTMKMESIAYHCLEVCQLKVNDNQGRCETLKEAISFMETCFAAEVYEMEHYATLLHNLGSTYLAMTQVEMAESCFARAVQVFNDATDLTPAEKQKHLKGTQTMLERSARW